MSNPNALPSILSGILLEHISLNIIEPGIYSIYSDASSAGSYDSFGASTIYDMVACNRFYNWLMWGYSTRDYAALCQGTLSSSPDGLVLDVACGSLAFTAEVYAGFRSRPVIFLDLSLKLLRKGKSRIERQKGLVPENMIFLHADALKLPFRDDAFKTVISLNLLHCINDAKKALTEIKRILKNGGNSVITTLVKSNRWSNRYMGMLAGFGALISRSPDELLSEFDQIGMSVTHQIKGNLMFIRHGRFAR